MSHAAAGAGAGAIAAHQAAIANAIKASGAIVQVDTEDFLTLLELADEPLVVKSTGGFFTTNHQYLTSVRGLFFYLKTESELTLPSHVMVIKSRKIWIPG